MPTLRVENVYIQIQNDGYLQLVLLLLIFISNQREVYIQI